MQKILIFALFVAFAFAQFPQNGPLTVNVVNSSFSDALGAVANYNYSLNVKIYSLYVPNNALYVNTTFTNNDFDDCGYLNFWMRVHGLPCSSIYYNENYICSQGYNPDDGISDYNNDLIYSGWYNDDNLFEWTVGQNWYMAVGRYSYSSDYASQNCPYSLAFNFATCPSGQSSFVVNDAPGCITVNQASFGVKYDIAVPSGDAAAYMVTVPANTGYILATLMSNSDDNYLYGKSYGVPGLDNYNCETEDYDYSNGGNYTYNLICYTPRSGDFYFLIYDLDESFNGSITFTSVVCPMNMGGFNCSFSLTSYPLNSTSVTSLNIPFNDNYLSYFFVYYYFDIPANYTNTQTFTVFATGDTDAFLYVRRDGFPEESSTWGMEDGNERNNLPASYTFNNFDWQVPGRIYIALSCEDDGQNNNCAVQFGANSTQTTSSSSSSSSSGVVTTAAVTTAKGLTTAALTTAKGLTTAAVTSAGLTTAKGLTTSALTTAKGLTTGIALTTGMGSTTASHASGVSVILPSIVLAIVAAFVALF